MHTSQAKKVLIVEDEVPTALALGDKFEHEGFLVSRAQNGREGLKMALEEHPDLIMADIRMPEMTGLEMIAELRKDSWGAKAEVLILTNVSDVEKVDEAMRFNAFHYIVKGDTTMETVVNKARSILSEPKE